MPTDNERLDRLFEYTKFHIGIYLLAAGAMVTIASSEQTQGFFEGLCMPFLWVAIAAMVVAGMAGGIIASSCASDLTFHQVWNEEIAFWPVTKRWKGCRGLV